MRHERLPLAGARASRLLLRCRYYPRTSLTRVDFLLSCPLSTSLSFQSMELHPPSHAQLFSSTATPANPTHATLPHHPVAPSPPCRPITNVSYTFPNQSTPIHPLLTQCPSGTSPPNASERHGQPAQHHGLSAVPQSPYTPVRALTSPHSFTSSPSRILSPGPGSAPRPAPQSRRPGSRRHWGGG